MKNSKTAVFFSSDESGDEEEVQERGSGGLSERDWFDKLAKSLKCMTGEHKELCLLVGNIHKLVPDLKAQY